MSALTNQSKGITGVSGIYKPKINNQKAKQYILDFCNDIKKKEKNEKQDPPMSVLHSKLVIPIFYSNLITIEDISFENSNYFLNTNGFLTSNVKLKSSKHYQNFTFQDCIFRIFPKTYNINKYKIINTLKKKSK